MNDSLKKKQDVELEKKLIKEWLKKNKPSTQFKDEKPMGHVTPMATLGDGVIIGEKL